MEIAQFVKSATAEKRLVINSCRKINTPKVAFLDIVYYICINNRSFMGELPYS